METEADWIRSGRSEESLTWRLRLTGSELNDREYSHVPCLPKCLFRCFSACGGFWFFLFLANRIRRLTKQRVKDQHLQLIGCSLEKRGSVCHCKKARINEL